MATLTSVLELVRAGRRSAGADGNAAAAAAAQQRVEDPFWYLDAAYERLVTAGPAGQCSPKAKRRSTREQSFSVQH
jgi:hypothetical protein